MTDEKADKEEEEVKVELESPGTLRIFDPFLFLIGNRGAIERIAATPLAFLVGAILVVSAGIARNYDHLVLTKQFEWIIGPFIASIVTTTFVYIWVAGGIRHYKFKDKRGYLTFLTLVWMTAPCAWLYGIPVESFTDIVTATKWNIAFLAIVSLWRVVLMIRAISVLTETPLPRASLLVLTPAALEMMVGTFFKSLSIVGIMGGVRLSPQDQLLLNATSFTGAVSFWTFILGAILLFIVKGRAAKPLSRPKAGIPDKAFIPAAIFTLLWFLAAVPHHTQINNRYTLQQLLYGDQYEDAVAFASDKQRSDFPDTHYLPPEPSKFGERDLELLDKDLPDWLREEWTHNAIESFKSPMRLRMMLHYEDDIYNDVLAELHPTIAEALHAYAAELEAKPSLGSNERWWLGSYHSVKELAGTVRESPYD